jgi:putative ABC transport system ATP-binding protein
MTLLEVKNLKKTYATRFGNVKVPALTNVSFTVEKGEYIAIMGESGSGKTTLLNLIATLDKPTGGEILLDGKSLLNIPEGRLAAFRRDNLGFVFQDFNLLDTFSLRDNIYLPLVLAGKAHKEMAERILPIAYKLGVTDVLDKFPYEVSGGQKQRCAVARALITAPRMILADEPTGALDSHSAEALLNVFRDINAAGQTIFMVTHSVKAASNANRVLFLRDGEIFHQLYRGERSNEELFAVISDTLTAMAAGGERHA